MNYEIRIDWDDEAQVWFVEESNVPGLVGESPTLEAMMALLRARVLSCHDFLQSRPTSLH
jgi:hypothetical protein